MYPRRDAFTSFPWQQKSLAGFFILNKLVRNRISGNCGTYYGDGFYEIIMQSKVLEQQLSFLREIDRLKSVIRQSPLLDKSRRENSAEHSWHLAMYAMLLSEYACGQIDVNRVIRMLLLHDIVKIDVGDFPIHTGLSIDVQTEQEASAAKRLFGLLPERQRSELLALWQEFELAETDDAKFAKALDRFQPLLINIFTDGGTWTSNAVSLEQVYSRYGPVIKTGAPLLWDVCEQWVIRHFAAQAQRTPAQSG